MSSFALGRMGRVMLRNSGSSKTKRNGVPALDDLDDFDSFDRWPPELVGNICVACDLLAVVNDLGLCRRCNTKLDRDTVIAS